MLIPGTVIQGRYRIIRQIGGGGQALVYLAEDTNLGSLRAIKELTHDPDASPQERQVAYDQFQREARILAMLNHPNLARVWDHFRVGGNAYLVMDYIDGQTLQEIVDQTSGFLPEAAVLRWASQLCDVLDYLHRQHPPIIFRDLKPSNVMLHRSDTVKLIDFGIVRHFKPGQTADTLSMGTSGYAPLEQHGQGQTDARSDIYALGTTLYHLLTRHEPEPAPDRVMPGQPDPIQQARAHNPRIRPATEAALAKAMAVDPVQRFQSALEMKQAVMSAPTAPTTTATVWRPAAGRRIELRWLLLGLAAFLVVLVWCLVAKYVTSTLVPSSPTATPTVTTTPTVASTPSLTHTSTATPILLPPTSAALPPTHTTTATPTPQVITDPAQLTAFKLVIGQYRLAEKAALRTLDPAVVEQLPAFAHGEALAAIMEQIEVLTAQGLYQELVVQQLNVQQVMLWDNQTAGVMVHEEYTLWTYLSSDGEHLVDEEMFERAVVYSLIYLDSRWKVERIRPVESSG